MRVYSSKQTYFIMAHNRFHLTVTNNGNSYQAIVLTQPGVTQLTRKHVHTILEAKGLPHGNTGSFKFTAPSISEKDAALLTEAETIHLSETSKEADNPKTHVKRPSAALA